MIFVVILLVITVYLVLYLCNNRSYQIRKIENFSNLNTITRNKPEVIYDKFYSQIYDELFLSDVKNEFECMIIHKDFLAKSKNNNILDLGCGTGSHMKILSRYGHNITGLDQSKYMIKQAMSKNSKNKLEYKVGDFHNKKLFKPKTFNVIICLFFTIYYTSNLNLFFKNCNIWLKQKGYLFIHLVNRSKFDPILDRSSSLIPFFDPQKYVSQRNTKTNLSFNKFNYSSDWKFKQGSTCFRESIQFPEMTRINKHYFNMYKQKYIVNTAKKYGFKLVKVYEELTIGYKYNYILVLQKLYG